MTHHIGPNLKLSQKQILYGTILGGSSLSKPKNGINCCLTMRDRNYDWLSYKVAMLEGFFKQDHNTIKKDKNTYRCFSISYPVFNEVYDLFYEDSKKVISPKILNSLSDLAWMVWFVDAGKKLENEIRLRTNKFGESGTKLLEEYFNSLDCECALSLNYQKKYELKFSNQGSYKFLKIVAHRMPKFVVKEFFY
jgi:hypothetical protein